MNGVLLAAATLAAHVLGDCTAPTGPSTPENARSVLYILVDDLRPDLGAYGSNQALTPNIDKLASEGTVFLRAYTQIAVCSPSRMSFLTGRRPNATRTWNFINHVRQADCGLEEPSVRYDVDGAAFIRNVTIFNNMGGAGQCCSLCTLEPECQFWQYVYASKKTEQNCTLLKSRDQGRKRTDNLTVSGRRGRYSFDDYITMPEMFRNANYFTLGTGKVFHTEEGGSAPSPWNGTGMPPNQDPPSWTPGCSMFDVNAVANMWACKKGSGPNPICEIDTSPDGEPTDPSENPLCDRTIRLDALAKLRLAAAERAKTGRQFFLAVGFRKPHMPWRVPSDFVARFNNVSISVPKNPTMDSSVPPVAHFDEFLQTDPYQALKPDAARKNRLYYHVAQAWMDYNLGLVLSELESLGLADDTLVILHSDHGWSLGENGQWEKFTNWENGVRVPLIVRAPWIKGSAGKKTKAIVELVDVMQSMAELADVPLPANQSLEGASFASVLRGEPFDGKPYALSVYPRCPQSDNSSLFWQKNNCLFVDRSEFRIMGLSIRTDRYRYTEWRNWDGAQQKTDFASEPVGVELYDHQEDRSEMNFDNYEHVNLAVDPTPEYEAAIKELQGQLKEAFYGYN